MGLPPQSPPVVVRITLRPAVHDHCHHKQYDHHRNARTQTEGFDLFVLCPGAGPIAIAGSIDIAGVLGVLGGFVLGGFQPGLVAANLLLCRPRRS